MGYIMPIYPLAVFRLISLYLPRGSRLTLCNESLRINNFLLHPNIVFFVGKTAVKNAFLFHMIIANLLSQFLLN